MSTLLGRIKRKVISTLEKPLVRAYHRKLDAAKVDPRITAPCYKSFDDLIDVERLRSLDEYVTERVGRHVSGRDDEKFYTGSMTVSATAPKFSGSRVICLTKSTREYRYTDLNNADLWEPTEDAAEFESLMDFIRTLPFKRTGRVIIMYDGSGSAVTAHRDHVLLNVCHEFLWFRTNMGKPFYMLDRKTGAKKYVESHSAWFDTCNQFHGADATPGLSVSMRVDGTFSDELRARIPFAASNLASTASLWACAGDNKQA